MKPKNLRTETGYLLYLHILPKFFGPGFASVFQSNTLTVVMNVRFTVPNPGEKIVFAHHGDLTEAQVHSVVATSTWNLSKKVTTHPYTVNALPVPGTVIDVKTMQKILRKRGCRYLNDEGEVVRFTFH